MQLMKWNPTRDYFSLRRHMNGLFDDFFYPSRRTTDDKSLWNWNPAVDIYEDDDNIVVKAEIPGMDKESIDVVDTRMKLKEVDLLISPPALLSQCSFFIRQCRMATSMKMLTSKLFVRIFWQAETVAAVPY